jgi:LPXTG-site transpeptidase (sortase) family protein
LVIPKAKVDHRLVTKGLTPRREMEDPGGKDDVAWYNFSTLPGFGSNAVLSGHVDWYTGERGVFWYLRNLQAGDEAQIHYSDGTVITYRVMRVEVYGAKSAPVAEITGPTTSDQLTMITCDGVFQRSSHDYTDRRVVYAERVT